MRWITDTNSRFIAESIRDGNPRTALSVRRKTLFSSCERVESGVSISAVSERFVSSVVIPLDIRKEERPRSMSEERRCRQENTLSRALSLSALVS